MARAIVRASPLLGWMSLGRLGVSLLLALLLLQHDIRTDAQRVRKLMSGTTQGRLSAVAVTGTGQNYFVTTGNGSWGYSFYANNGNLNGNNQRDYYYPDQNYVYSAAVSNYPTFAGTLAARNPYFQTATVIAVSMEAPASLFELGITRCVFTGPRTGVAVGAFNLYQGYSNTFSATILLTLDGAESWLAATGIPQQQSATVLTTGVAQGTWGAPGAPTPWPPLTPGDLTSAYFASPTLGWAVGGNAVGLAATISTWQTPTLGQRAAADGTYTPMGMVLLTANGGTIWKGVPIFAPFSRVNAAYLSADDATARGALFNAFPGILFSVQSDGAGRNVFAVGSPGSTFSTSATADVRVTRTAQAVIGLTVRSYPTILTSPNAGVSWVTRDAPLLWGGVAYTLFSVAVAKGSTAVAVGGSATVPFGAGSAGAILYTVNGGLTWVPAVYPGAASANVPCLMTAAVQPASGHAVKPIWAGGYATQTDFAFLTLGAGLLLAPGAADFYPVAAQAGFLTSGGAAVSSGNRTQGAVYTVLMSMDGAKTFVAAPAATFPPGFVQASFKHDAGSALLEPRHVYGITWDNGNRGWMYGYGFILSTRNGGASWVYETPGDVANTQAAVVKVVSIANVPSLEQ